MVEVSSNLINIKNLNKSFNNNGIKLEILNELYFDIQKAETIAIVGASGIGKSTLLHIIGTIDRPDNGLVLYNDQNVFIFNDIELAKFRNEKIGFVFQFHHLLSEFSTLENVMMPALIKGLDKKKSKFIAEEILFRVGLKDRLNNRVNQLSGGEQQRTALARSLVLKPLVLLADEPTGNLDKKNSDQVHSMLLELNKEFSMTMIIVTHNMELANLMSKKVTIYEGKIKEC